MIGFCPVYAGSLLDKLCFNVFPRNKKHTDTFFKSRGGAVSLNDLFRDGHLHQNFGICLQKYLGSRVSGGTRTPLRISKYCIGLLLGLFWVLQLDQW